MDLRVIEDEGNGGDLVKAARDLEVIDGLQNMPYLALFGGNVAADTKNDRLPTEQDLSWWGNSIISPDDSTLQFNSLTERALRKNPLTSFGAAQIEQAVRSDLRFMKDFCRVQVAVSIVSTDRVAIGIILQEPDNEQERNYLFIWDATKSELSLPVKTGTTTPQAGGNGFFDYVLDFQFI